MLALRLGINERLYSLEAGKFPLIIKLDRIINPMGYIAIFSWRNLENMEPFYLKEGEEFPLPTRNKDKYPTLQLMVPHGGIKHNRIKLALDTGPEVRIYREEVLRKVNQGLIRLADRAPQEIITSDMLNELERSRRLI